MVDMYAINYYDMLAWDKTKYEYGTVPHSNNIL